MTAAHWIICERSTRWTAAIRTHLAREYTPRSAEVNLVEVRSLGEIADWQRKRQLELALIEVIPEYLEATLMWLSDFSSRRSQVTAVALLDDSFGHRTDQRGDSQPSNRDEVECILREAGVAEAIFSPRALQSLARFRSRPSSRNAAQNRPAPGETIEAWAGRLLPWQDARRPIG